MEKRPAYVISVDIGTSSVRACLFSIDLKNIYSKQIPVSLETDITGKAEQDYNEVKSAVFESISDVSRWATSNQFFPKAICFSNAIASLVCVNSNFEPIRPVLTYADLRAREEAEFLKKNIPGNTLRDTGCPMHASFWLPKFKWLEKEGFQFSKGNSFCTIKDLIVLELTGQFVTDTSNAVATGMCNIRTGAWDEQMLKTGGISAEQLPRIMQTTDILSLEKNERTAAMQLPADLKIVLGATDGVLSSLGAGAYKPGQVTTMIGSSGACRIAADSPLIQEKDPITWSFPLDEHIWIRGGAMNNGGLVTQWLVDTFFMGKQAAGNDAFDEMLTLAGNTEACSDGLIFLPYIFGERAPIWDEKARGVYFGIHGSHQRGHFARATLEGILFAMYSIYEVITSDHSSVLEVRATGGYLRSELMVQIQADIFGIPVCVPSNFEGSSIGAAILAFKAMGCIDSYDEISEFLKVQKMYKPDEKKTLLYRDQFEKFKKIYEHVKDVY